MINQLISIVISIGVLTILIVATHAILKPKESRDMNDTVDTRIYVLVILLILVANVYIAWRIM